MKKAFIAMLGLVWLLTSCSSSKKAETESETLVNGTPAQGITIDFLTPFNEPTQLYDKNSFASIWELVRDHLGPLFEKEQVATRLAAR